MRGYGRTDQPEQIDQYTLLHLVGDMVGLVEALGEKRAVIAGHDWGAPVAWHAALMRPDRFRAVIGLSVPFRPRSPVRPTSAMPVSADAWFYQLYFQEPGVAEAELERDVRRSIRSILYAASGDMPKAPNGLKRVVLAGQVGVKPDGAVAGDLAAQIEQAWDNLLACLASEKLGLEHLVKIVYFTTVSTAEGSSCRARSAQHGTQNKAKCAYPGEATATLTTRPDAKRARLSI